EPFAHLAKRRPQPEDVRPHQNAGSCTARRTHEVTVGRAIRCRYVYIRFGNGDRVGDSREHHGDTCPQHNAELFARHQPESFILSPVLFEMILITHTASSFWLGCGRSARVPVIITTRSKSLRSGSHRQAPGAPADALYAPAVVRWRKLSMRDPDI